MLKVWNDKGEYFIKFIIYCNAILFLISQHCVNTYLFVCIHIIYFFQFREGRLKKCKHWQILAFLYYVTSTRQSEMNHTRIYIFMHVKLRIVMCIILFVTCCDFHTRHFVSTVFIDFLLLHSRLNTKTENFPTELTTKERNPQAWVKVPQSTEWENVTWLLPIGSGANY